MQVVLTGHAGMFVSSGGSSILCDPWFSPAYFGSWFPFPDNVDVDVDAIASPRYLYVSHLHKDHFDARFLAEQVDKSATVLLPEFPLDELRRALEALGFTRFVETTDGEPVDIDGFRVAICTETDPSDGPLGDSTLAVDDGEHRLLDQNDCRPRDLDLLGALGPYDLHLLQYSGAIWYPMVYRLDPESRAHLGEEKRLNQMSRALRYVEQVKASHVVPFAGPPAFLDDDLFWLNDLDGDPANIFVDQPAFIEFLADRGVHNAHLGVPGSVFDLAAGDLRVTHPSDPEAIFTGKRAYLEHYRIRRRPEIDAACPQLLGPSSTAAAELVGPLATWWEPLLAGAPRVRRHLGGPIVIDFGGSGVVIEPSEGAVRRWVGEEWEHYFAVDAALVRSLVERHVDDWVNELFLSCRFEAARTGAYNGTVFSFFKCLSPERMAYLEASLSPRRRAAARRLTDADRAGEGETWRCGDYVVTRRCPHLGGDLARFGEVEGQTLTCTLHGWRFDLETGRCLTADDVHLETRRA